ncbi:dihydrofolate reductase family protein [Actinomadura sp. 6K520]|uniref:dihydrofolate reductase family protein n=1 Tax=Actinomadura sp. 6K520 TaxID=2530364 RepID=UPI00104E6CB5|nr:dihydrofolate reductase family protein [Actinomadura sp. 6K520]TDE26454.1 dihydrofolate reductase [Actinomadura sp. 6K520]
MGKLILVEHLTLDGVMQAPGRVDEDVRDGFAHGGWAVPGNDEVMASVLGKDMGVALLFGRRTYEDFHGFWPHQDDNPFTDVLNRARKYVVSTTLREAPWENSVLLRDVGDVEGIEEGLTVLGSGVLARELMRRGLVDEWLLMVHPLVLGTGRRLFDGVEAGLRLVESVVTTTGVVIATYRGREEA